MAKLQEMNVRALERALTALVGDDNAKLVQSLYRVLDDYETELTEESDAAFNTAYDAGYDQGYEDGAQDGRSDGYRLALQAFTGEQPMAVEDFEAVKELERSMDTSDVLECGCPECLVPQLADHSDYDEVRHDGMSYNTDRGWYNPSRPLFGEARIA